MYLATLSTLKRLDLRVDLQMLTKLGFIAKSLKNNK
jgi:hypothetical protein